MGTEIDRLEVVLEVAASKAEIQISKLEESLKSLAAILSGVNVHEALGADETGSDKKKLMKLINQ